MADEDDEEDDTDGHGKKTSTPDFGTSYEKARKGYAFTSALLLAWELIGIELEADKPPLESIHFTLKSPQAIPYVLIALVVYFGFRLTVEWNQAESERRQRLASRADFAVAHMIGMAALALYAIQALLQVQLANKLQSPSVDAFLRGLLVGILLSRLRWSLIRDWRRKIFALVSLAVFLVAIPVNFIRTTGVSADLVSLFVAGVVASLALFLAFNWYIHRSAQEARI